MKKIVLVTITLINYFHGKIFADIADEIRTKNIDGLENRILIENKYD